MFSTPVHFCFYYLLNFTNFITVVPTVITSTDASKHLFIFRSFSMSRLQGTEVWFWGVSKPAWRRDLHPMTRFPADWTSRLERVRGGGFQNSSPNHLHWLLLMQEQWLSPELYRRAKMSVKGNSLLMQLSIVPLVTSNSYVTRGEGWQVETPVNPQLCLSLYKTTEQCSICLHICSSYLKLHHWRQQLILNPVQTIHLFLAREHCLRPWETFLLYYDATLLSP